MDFMFLVQCKLVGVRSSTILLYFTWITFPECILLFHLFKFIYNLICWQGLRRTSLGAATTNNSCAIRTQNFYFGTDNMCALFSLSATLCKYFNGLHYFCRLDTRFVLQVSTNKCFKCGRRTFL